MVVYPTFLNIVGRVILPNKWKIYVDKINYKNISENFFLDNITYISQDIELLDTSFKENILLGKKYDEDKLKEIFEGCQLSVLLWRINNNLDICIWEKWIKISAGEKQRINIARGLVLARNILILDEVTANIDKVTSKKIYDFIFKKFKDKTIIVICHNLDISEYVNKKFVFENGLGLEKFD